MYKKDLALNNTKRVDWYAIKPNQQNLINEATQTFTITSKSF